MRRIRRAALLSLVTGFLGVAGIGVPACSSFEDDLGLGLMFRVRGPRGAPAAVAVVSIDEVSSERLGLPARLRDWSRATHARMVDRLVDLGVSVIAFDIQFFRHGASADDDQALADAASRSRRVLFVQQFEVSHVDGHDIWQRRDPIPVLSSAAAGLAPFPLPDSPLVSWFWMVLGTPQGDVPALPAAALQLHTRSAPSYGGRSTAYLNYFGPPGTICTIPYDALLNVEPDGQHACSLQGRAVFIGAGASRLGRADQEDTYHTVFSRSDGVDFSGVEIAATAFANLLERRTLQPVPLPVSLATLVLFGVCVAGGTYLVRTRERQSSAARGRLNAAIVALAVAVLYASSAQLLFSRFDRILPLVTPLLLQLPIGLTLALVVPPVRTKELLSGVCLSTDVAGYTALADRLGPQHLANLMHEYFESLRALVRRRGGEVLPSEGDGLMCLWRESSGTSAERLQACLAALEISEAVDRFNERHSEEPLPTRVGLHASPLVVQSDVDRGTGDLVGDAPNVAQRLQKLNQTLRTRVLASAAVVKGTEETLLVRSLGLFEIRGKNHGVTVFEILARHDQADESMRALTDGFAPALAAYEAAGWVRSVSLFEQLHARYPLDGPTAFYLSQARARTADDRAASAAAG